MIGRGAIAVVLAVSGAAGFVLVSACVDLFHSTDFETLCQVKPQAPGCPMAEAATQDAGDAAPEAAPTEFCIKWPTQMAARAAAVKACTWLGACNGPFDQNAFGPCMVNAILAYDCTTNPNRQVAGALHDYWDKLSQAKSCDDVPNLNPDNANCTGTGYGCLPGQPNVLLECLSGVSQPETCLVQGKVCDSHSRACGVPDPTLHCDPPSCDGTVLHACLEGGTDDGYDCKYFGASMCLEGAAEGGIAGCDPVQIVGSCAPTASVGCDGGAATACATGYPETVDCPGLVGDGGTCVSGTPSWNLAAACQGTTPDCEAGCEGEGNETLRGCAQGATFTTTCSKPFKNCRSVPLPEDASGYACGRP